MLVKLTQGNEIAHYPYQFSDLQRDNPNTGFPIDLSGADLAEFNAAVIQPTQSPAFNAGTERVVETTPELVGGKWLQRWSVEPLPSEEKRTKAKEQRTLTVERIKVTTQAGNTFDGDEVSQGRMARAILALSTNAAPSVNWVLADNSVIQATQAELTEALVLSGQAQAALWVIP